MSSQRRNPCPEWNTTSAETYTQFWMIRLKYQEIPFPLSPPLSSLSQAGHASSATVYLLPLTMQIWYSVHKKRQWLTASVANVHIVTHSSHVSVLLRKEEYQGMTNVNNAVVEVLVRLGILWNFSVLVLIHHTVSTDTKNHLSTHHVEEYNVFLQNRSFILTKKAKVSIIRHCLNTSQLSIFESFLYFLLWMHFLRY